MKNKPDKKDEFNAIKDNLQPSLSAKEKKIELNKEIYLHVKAKANLKYFLKSILPGLASF